MYRSIIKSRRKHFCDRFFSAHRKVRIWDQKTEYCEYVKQQLRDKNYNTFAVGYEYRRDDGCDMCIAHELDIHSILFLRYGRG